MYILPAIDLYDGCAVRLLRGDYAQMTTYSDDPAAVAKRFAAAGAEWLHLVDLEGAKSGGTPNADTVSAIASAGQLKIEIGGGVRSVEVIERYLSLGVSRVILGTAAITEPALLESAAKAYGAQLAVGVDLRDGKVAIRGWTETSAMEGMDFIARLEQLGIGTVIVTDISRDGAMRGTNLDLYRSLKEKFSLSVIASGGVSSLSDVRALGQIGVYGAILGRALYTGDLVLEEALAAAKEVEA
ncbi:MAG: 1-(5-phosphoribosyl)-5-[(5-phosphoribosylamino)methylideneamino]imidazole-4-carboxamide isomerase [Ruminococcaceae bacterium]|nr:1-(5-phosphoribosyl)-5-[(5-phosphoribosylamino)methylideneamino]imidazole-4-carboxamide isomerase [Oscillospiraceae bacterium]